MIAFIQNRLNKKVRKFVDREETLQAAFIAGTRPNWLRMVAIATGIALAITLINQFAEDVLIAAVLGGAFAGGIGFVYAVVAPYRVVAVTDRRIIILASRPTAASPTHILRELPRSTRLGTANQITSLGEPLWVDGSAKSQVRAADAAIPS